MNTIKKWSVPVVLGLLAAIWCGCQTISKAAFNLDFTNKPFYVITVTTSSTSTIQLPTSDVAVVHLGIQNDGSTDSATGDRIVLMHGTATMDATTADGEKAIVNPRGSVIFRGQDLRKNDDGPRALQIKAIGHGAKVMLIRGGESR